MGEVNRSLPLPSPNPQATGALEGTRGRWRRETAAGLTECGSEASDTGDPDWMGETAQGLNAPHQVCTTDGREEVAMASDVATLLDVLRLRGVLRSASHQETLAAADISAGTDTARQIIVRPLVGRGNAEYVVVTRLQAQGIRPSNLTITARDLNRSNFAVPLPPDLIVDDLPLFGDAHEGVSLVVRNNAAKPVVLTIHAAPVTRAQLEEMLSTARKGAA